MATKKTAKELAIEAKRAATTAKKDAAVAKQKATRVANSKLGGQAAGFMNFIREQGVIGLAVGLAVGAAAGASVKALVENFINPIVAFMIGGRNLSTQMWHTGIKNGNVELIFGWGAIVSSLITLFATALVVYLIIHGAKLDRLDKKKGA